MRFKILLFCLVIFLGIVSIEGFLTLINIYPPIPNTYAGEYEFRESPNFIADEAIGWRMKPNYQFRWPVAGKEFLFTSNGDGFRKPVGNAESKANAARTIVAVGDSFMWGYGVEYHEMCSSLLQAKLKDTRVWNFAMPSFGLDQIWLTLREWGLAKKPDLVVVGIYTNDCERVFDACRMPECITKPLFKLEDGTLVRQTEDDWPNVMVRTLERYSRVYNLITRIKRKLGFRYGIGSWWAINQAFIDAICADCEEAGVPVLFLHFPLLDGRPFPALNRYMREQGIPFIDFVDEWGGPRRDLYIVEDPHLNAAGHRYVGETALHWIRENLGW